MVASVGAPPFHRCDARKRGCSIRVSALPTLRRMLEGAEITLLGVGLAAIAVWAGWLAVRLGRRDADG